jgi:hypothetical protein
MRHRSRRRRPRDNLTAANDTGETSPSDEVKVTLA